MPFINFEAESRITIPVKIAGSIRFVFFMVEPSYAVDREDFSSCLMNAYLNQKRTQKKTCSLFSTILLLFFLFWFLSTIIKT